MFTVYVLHNNEGRLYIGQTADLEQRIRAHNEGMSKWTSTRGPWHLVYEEQFTSREEALKRERVLKSGHENMALRKRLGLKKNAPSEDEA